MKRNYQFYDKEALNPTNVLRFDFPQPFEGNVDKWVKSEYGEALTFVKEINHRSRVIKLHGGYDSGKGTKYVPALTAGEKRAAKERFMEMPFAATPVTIDYGQYSLSDLPELCKNPDNKIIALNVYKRNTPGVDLRQTLEYVSALIEKMTTHNN